MQSQYNRRAALTKVVQHGAAIGALCAAAPALRPDAAAAAPTNEATAKVADFSRSCVRWRIDTTKKPPATVSRKLPMTLNNVRAVLDARATIRNKSTGQVFDYVLMASCKAEQVWVARDVWHDPNADMCVIAGQGEFLIVKRWDKADKGVMRFPAALGVQPERQLENPDECFDRFSINMVWRRGRVLENVDAIIETLGGDTPVVAQTEYEAAGYHVLLEYPVKVVNFSERERYYQVDTGPVLLPDFAKTGRSPIEGCQLAYVAHNCPEWAEFLVCAPTPLTDSIKVHHYSKTVRLENVQNRMIAIA